VVEKSFKGFLTDHGVLVHSFGEPAPIVLATLRRRGHL